MYRLQWSWDLLERCPHFRGCYVQASMDLKMCERCPHFRGCYVQASMDLKMCERCPHFRGCYVQASMDLKMCERCPHFRGCYVYTMYMYISSFTVHVHCTCTRIYNTLKYGSSSAFSPVIRRFGSYVRNLFNRSNPLCVRYGNLFRRLLYGCFVKVTFLTTGSSL